MNVKIKKLSKNARTPAYATKGSAALDLCAAIDEPLNLRHGEIALVPTGIAIEPDRSDCVSIVAARSGLSIKHGISLANGIGVIDSDYRGEIKVGLINHGEDYTLEPGERIAQLMFMNVITATLTEVSELSETERGEGGFGSTGRK